MVQTFFVEIHFQKEISKDKGKAVKNELKLKNHKKCKETRNLEGKTTETTAQTDSKFVYIITIKHRI